jgi:hypothetical protein
MARRRYQKPTPERRGNQWTILVREDVVENRQRTRKVKRVSLGPSTLTRAEAERARDDYLADINQAQVGIGGQSCSATLRGCMSVMFCQLWQVLLEIEARVCLRSISIPNLETGCCGR